MWVISVLNVMVNFTANLRFQKKKITSCGRNSAGIRNRSGLELSDATSPLW